MKKRCSVFLIVAAIALCLVCAAILAACSVKEADKSLFEYVYDGQSGGYIINGVRENNDERLEIPAEINGKSVVGVSCKIFTNYNFSEYVFGGEVFFIDNYMLADADLSGLKLVADRHSINCIRAELYKCASYEPIRENALALANGATLIGLDNNENYISFDYDWQAYSACGGNVLPVFIGNSGDLFDIEAYAEDCDYVIHRDKTSVYDLNRAYSYGNGCILDDITVDGASVFGGYTISDNSVAKVNFERVYRVYIGGGNDENYDVTKVQPDFCYDELNGEKLDFRYVTQSGADELLNGINLRKGFALGWEYSVHTESQNVANKKLVNLSTALAKEGADLNVYPVWTANVPEIEILSSADDNVITYGEDVTFSAQAIGAEDGFSLVYEWRHNGAIIGTESTLKLEKPSLEGAYDGVYAVKVTIFQNSIAVATAEAEVTLRIEKLAVVVSWDDSEIYYNGQVQAPKAEAYGAFGEKLAIEVLGGGVNAGTYTATAVTNSSDYTLSGGEKNFTILKAPLTVKARDCSVVYGSQPNADVVDYVGFKGGDDESVLKGTLEYLYTNTSSQVGKYTNCVCVSGLSADNYEIEYVGGCLEILPRAVELSWSGYSNLVYDGQTHYISAVACDISEGDDVSVELTGGCALNAGDYTATAVLVGKDSGNYVLAGSGSLDFTVAKADITLTVHLDDTEYGASLTPSVTGNTGNGAVAYSYGTSQDKFGTALRLSVGKYYVCASVEETENYNSAVAVSSFDIIPREVALTWKNCENLVYNSEAKNVSAEIGNALFGDSVSIRVTGGNEVDAGSFVAVAELVGKDADNYSLPELHTCSYTIEKCGVSIVAENKTSVYSENLEELTAEVFGTIYNGEVSYTLRKEEGIDAGVYAVDVIVGEYANYEIKTVSAKYYIIKKTPTIVGAIDGKVELPDCVVYGSTLSELTGRLPSASVSGSWTWADGGYKSVGDTGRKSFAATFKPTDTKNYNEVKTELSFYVKKVNGFEVFLGSPNEVTQYTDPSVPYRLIWDGDVAIIDYIIPSEWDEITKDGLTVSVVRKDGAAANAAVNGLTVTLHAAGVYLLTFECKETDEYMSGSITVTVVVE